jgi:TRAP-type mannitol/chloroaromatic compound transport system permease small subunit
MTEYDLAAQDLEAIKATLMICLNFGVLVAALGILYDKYNIKNKQSFAVEMVGGILCLLPEIIDAFMLIMPLIVTYAVWEVSTRGLIANGVYLCTLWVFRKKILEISKELRVEVS